MAIPIECPSAESPFKDFDSSRYWAECDLRIAQKFYVTLSLYISAMADYAVGLDLGMSKKLNWATTASYYSIVHSCRMIVFAALGTFPMGHGTLSGIFTGKKWRAGMKTRGRTDDWLRSFVGVRNNESFLNPRDISLESLTIHYCGTLGLVDAAQCFEALSAVLNNAKSLREDSNYEALLIANEHKHRRVAAIFQRLAPLMCKANQIAISVSTKCLEAFVVRDSLLAEDRCTYEYFAQTHIAERIAESIGKRIGRKSVLEEVRRVTHPIETLYSRHRGGPLEPNQIRRLEQLDRDISMEFFGEKARRMDDFEAKVNSLEINIGKARSLL